MNDTTFKVTVSDRTTTTHTVTVSPEYWQKLTGGTVPAEKLIEKSFEFLLEREPNTCSRDVLKPTPARMLESSRQIEVESPLRLESNTGKHSERHLYQLLQIGSSEGTAAGQSAGTGGLVGLVGPQDLARQDARHTKHNQHLNRYLPHPAAPVCAPIPDRLRRFFSSSGEPKQKSLV